MPVPAVFEALAAPRRRQILKLVWERELSAGDIHRAVPGVTFGAISQHLGVLESAGLVARREEGRFRFYAARRKEMGHLARWLETMWDKTLPDLKRHAESEERLMTGAAARSRSKNSQRRRSDRLRRRRGVPL